MKTYCIVCKKFTDNNNLKTVRNNERLMMKSSCSICGKKKKKIYFTWIWFIR